MALGEHITMRLRNDAVIARTAEERRAVARAVLGKAIGCRLLAFGLADTHLHLLVACARAAAGRLAAVIALSLHRRLRLESGFSPAHFTPVKDARHLYSAFSYVLRQAERHKLTVDPLREASNLPDLLGLRPLGGYTRGNVRRILPRVQRADLLELLQLPALEPASTPISEIVLATLAATALPDLDGRALHVVEARRAAIEVVGSALPVSACARLLAIEERSVYRLRERPADAELVLAIRRNLDLIRQRGSAIDPESAFLKAG
jgi:hypothetical protein